MPNLEIMLKNYKSITLTIALLLAPMLLAGCSKYNKARENLKFAFPEYIKCDVMQVVDADTFHCQYRNSDIEKIRLIGVKIPESIGEKATEFTKSYLRRETPVNLELDEEIRDNHGRILAYVYLPGGEMLNAILLKEGYAQVATAPPNIKFKDLFLKLETEAREQGKGLWEK